MSIKAGMFNRRAKKAGADEITNKLNIKPDQKIADIGSGGGYITFLFAEKAAKVYALDINKEFLEFIDKQADKRGLNNIKTVIVKGDPILPEKVDIIFMRNVYHHIEDRVNYFRSLKKFLNKDGKIVIVEWKKQGTLISHHTEKETILKELDKAGYNLKKEYKLNKQSFLVFESR